VWVHGTGSVLGLRVVVKSPHRRRAVAVIVAGTLLGLVLGGGAATGQPMDGTRLVTDAAGDVGPLPDCEAAEASEPGAAEDILAVEVFDEAGTRIVTVRTDGDLSASVANATDARVEVWVTSDEGSGIYYKFRRGVEAGEPIDDVVDADDQPVEEAAVAVDAGSGGEAIFQFPHDLLDRLGLLADGARFGVVVVAGPRCDKLGLGRVGLGIRLLEPFSPIDVPVVTTSSSGAVTPPEVTLTGAVNGPTETEPSETEAGDRGIPSWAVVLFLAAIILVLALIAGRDRFGLGRASRAHCEALQQRCEELRRRAAEAEAAVGRAAAGVDAADEQVREARRRFIDARDAARDADDAAAAAAAEGADESNWVAGDEGRVTQGDLELSQKAAQDAQERYERKEISGEELEAEWSRLHGEDSRAELRRQRDARAREAADRAEAARAAENIANEIFAAAQAAADAAREALREAKAARDRALEAADEACSAAAACFENLEEGGIIPPPPPLPENLDFGA